MLKTPKIIKVGILKGITNYYDNDISYNKDLLLVIQQQQ